MNRNSAPPEMSDRLRGRQLLHIGQLSREELERRQPIYARRAQRYQPDSTMVHRLAAVTAEIEVIAFFGTWCSTCKHHLPALMETLDLAENPSFKITYVGLDEDALEPADWIERCGIHTTPSMVVIHAGEEIGRIENEPEVSVEADLVSILSHSEIN